MGGGNKAVLCHRSNWLFRLLLFQLGGEKSRIVLFPTVKRKELQFSSVCDKNWSKHLIMILILFLFQVFQAECGHILRAGREQRERTPAEMGGQTEEIGGTTLRNTTGILLTRRKCTTTIPLSLLSPSPLRKQSIHRPESFVTMEKKKIKSLSILSD